MESVRYAAIRRLKVFDVRDFRRYRECPSDRLYAIRKITRTRKSEIVKNTHDSNIGGVIYPRMKIKLTKMSIN